MPFARVLSFLRRLLRGDDVILVPQTKEQWEQQFASGAWDRLQTGQPNTAELARFISEYAHARGVPVRVFDAGCGNGGLARLLNEEPNVLYTGIDISETALATARRAAPNGHFIVADIEQPPLDLGVFDVLVFNEILYYVNPDRVLPRYRIHAAANAPVLVSVVRSWRTPFLFFRIRRHVRAEKRLSVGDSSGRWDIIVGHFL